jgi:hypothetical protein
VDSFLNAFPVFFKYPKYFVKFLLARHTRLWEDRNLEEFSEHRLRVVGWIDMAQDKDRDRDRWRTPVHAVLNLRVVQNAGNCLTVRVNFNLSNRTSLHAVS